MGGDEDEPIERSTLDRGSIRQRLQDWLGKRLPEAAAPTISEVSTPSATGMSSETLLFDASWSEACTHRTASFAGRLAPDEGDVPVFPRYDLESQFRLLELIDRHSNVPVPAVRWLELDPEPLGAPFFVMDRVEGRVPPDIPPYVFAGWILDTTPEKRNLLQESTIATLAELHAIDPIEADASFLEFPVEGDSPLRRHVQNQRDYYAWVVADGTRHPLLERAFDWLDANWPSDEGAAVISWGDSRIGNVLYDGFEPAALLDWEMAGLAPREVDLGWMCFMHTFFQDIAEGAGLPGLPDFLQLPDAAERYERASGHRPRDLGWYYTYAALRHGIIMSRIQRRIVHFGQSEGWGDDPDDAIPHRKALERLID